MEGAQLGEGTLGGVSSVAFFWVGLAQCKVASQAIPHLKHPSVQDSLMKGYGAFHSSPSCPALFIYLLIFLTGNHPSGDVAEAAPDPQL